MAILDKLIEKQLRTDEQVKIILRRFPLAYWKSSSVITVLLLGPAVGFFQLLSVGRLGAGVIALAWGIAVLWILRTLFIWSIDSMVITNQRLIDVDQGGLLSREISECPLETIQDIRSLQKGLGAHIFDYGTLKVQTASHDEHFELTHIRHPVQMQELLFSIRQKYSNKTLHERQDETQDEDEVLI